MTTATLTPTATETALSLIRDQDSTFEQLARHFGDSEAFVAGLLDAVCDDTDWSLMFTDHDVEPTRAEREDYERGFRHGQALVEAEALADGWADCYALAAVEDLRAAEPLPIAADDVPW